MLKRKLRKFLKRSISQLIYLLTLLKYSFRGKDGRDNKKLLIIKLDAIGDYILFRNFLEEIKKGEEYKDYEITFLGNNSVKELAETLDSSYINNYIWLDRKVFFKNPLSIFKTINQINTKFNTVIHATYSREFIGDLLVKLSGAENRIGFDGDCSNISLDEKNKTDKWYTKLIEINPKTNFEFYKNREFCGEVLKTQLNISKPFIDIKALKVNDLVESLENFIVLFPGAQQDFRKWPAEKFRLLGEYLMDTLNCNVVVCGSKSDAILAAEINKNNNKRIIDLTGKTNLAQLIKVMSRAKLIISNDTSGAHIGAALNVPTIVLSQFNHYSRFVPYPKEISDKMICLLPHIFEDLSEEELIEKFKFGSTEDISLISVDEVKQAINKLLL